jgi:hypothetical protein
MTDPLKKLAEDLKKVHLTSGEKNDMRRDLLKFMNDNPAKSMEEAPERSIWTEPKKSFWGSFATFLIPKPMPVLAAILIIAVSGGGVSYAAVDTLPGDFLYNVKVSLNEEVVAFLTFDEEQKLEYEIERSERRLVEAETLEEQDELDDRALAQLSDRIEAHDARIESLEMELEDRGQEDRVLALQTEYEAKLNAYEDLLFEILVEGNIPTEPVEVPPAGFEGEVLVADVDGDLDTPVILGFADVAEDTQEETLTDFIRDFRIPREPREAHRFLKEANDAMERAFDRFTAVSLYVDDVAHTTGYDRIAAALNALEKARSLYNDGNQLFHSQDYHEAYALFNRSYNLSDEAEVLASDENSRHFDRISADKAMSNAADYLDLKRQYVSQLIDVTGKEYMRDALAQLDHAGDRYSEGKQRMNEGNYINALNQFEGVIAYADDAERIAANLYAQWAPPITDPIRPVIDPVPVTPTPDPIPVTPTVDPYFDVATASKDEAFQIFTEVSVYVDGLINEIGYDRMKGAKNIFVNAAKSLYDEGNVLYVKEDYKAANNKFQESISKSREAERVANEELARDPDTIFKLDEMEQLLDRSYNQWAKVSDYVTDVSLITGKEPVRDALAVLDQAHDFYVNGSDLRTTNKVYEDHAYVLEAINWFNRSINLSNDAHDMAEEALNAHNTEIENNLQADAKIMRQNAIDRIAKVDTFIHDLEVKYGKHNFTRSRSRINAAQEAMPAAHKSYDGGYYESAYGAYKAALNTANTAHTMAEDRLDIVVAEIEAENHVEPPTECEDINGDTVPCDQSDGQTPIL